MENTANEIKNQLSKLYPYRIELHAHTTPISGCSQIPPAEMARLYSEHGYDGIAITNHFYTDNFKRNEKSDRDEAVDWYITGYEDTKKAAEKYGLHVYLGAELRFDESINDYLLFGADSEMLKICYDYLPKGLAAFRKEADLKKSVIIHAHPFRDKMEPCDPSLLDGIETFNMHPGHNSRIAFAVRYAAQQKFGIKTAGSDFHHPDLGHEALCALRTKYLPEDSFGLAEILRSGDYLLDIGNDSFIIP